jgi:hypothetical protein
MERESKALTVHVRELISAGALPCEDCVVTWYGPGRGRHCSACGQRILGTDHEIQCDVAGGGTIYFHQACYEVWQSALAAKS